jgi:hypothetical protein
MGASFLRPYRTKIFAGMARSHHTPADVAPQELHDNIEQPARSRAQSGRRWAKRSRPG